VQDIKELEIIMSRDALLFEYHNWSVNRMLKYIDDQCLAAFNEPVTSVFKSIRETFEHIYWADHTWFNRIQGLESRVDTPFKDVEQAFESFNCLHAEMSLYLKNTDLSQMVVYQNSTGVKFENTIEDILIHLVNHGTYHKGNITSILWSLGYKSLATDYIVFLREYIGEDGA
jgi:uncharacterized damage-inducible protein DinB